jgi:hypothetical protein
MITGRRTTVRLSGKLEGGGTMSDDEHSKLLLERIDKLSKAVDELSKNVGEVAKDLVAVAVVAKADSVATHAKAIVKRLLGEK